MSNKYIIPVILILLLVITFNLSCTSEMISSNSDETGSKTVIGYVDAEPFYLISIRDRVNASISFIRGQRNIYYQPTPSYLLRLEHSSLKSAIRDTGLRLPNYSLSEYEILELAEELAVKKGEEIVNAVRTGMTMSEAAEYFSVRLNRSPIKMYKGNNPGYDDAVWEVEIGFVSGPVVHMDRVLIFIVEDRGVDDSGREWSQVYLMDFIFNRDEARKITLDRMMSKWDIRITDKYYIALDQYFSNNLKQAETNIRAELDSGDTKNGLANYLLALILKDQGDEQTNINHNDEVIANLIMAINNCKDNELRPYLRYELGNLLVKLGNTDLAKDHFRDSFNEVKNNVRLAENLVESFEQIADEEYLAYAQTRLDELYDLVRREQVRPTPDPQASQETIEEVDVPTDDDDSSFASDETTDNSS